MMKYRVFGKKMKSRVHIVNPGTGMTICKAENNPLLGEHRDLDEKPKFRAMCKLCLPPAPPEFEEAEGRTSVVFQVGEQTITVGKKYPRFEERCAEIRKGAGQ